MKILFVLVAIGLAFIQASRRPSFPRVNLINRDRVVLPKEGHPHVPIPRITGGNEAVPHSRPWQAGLIIPIDLSFCGGSLLNEYTVLTAAHCVADAGGNVIVVLGAHNIIEDEDGQVIFFSSMVLVHERYDADKFWNDIALVILPEPAPINDIIQPIALPPDPSNSYAGEEANVSGWGKISDASGSISEVLREVTVAVISNDQCSQWYDLESFHLCTDGAGGKSTCSGDSGGPLVADGALIGIVSFGISLGCEVGYPAAYTRVTEYLDWINANKQ